MTNCNVCVCELGLLLILSVHIMQSADNRSVRTCIYLIRILFREDMFAIINIYILYREKLNLSKHRRKCFYIVIKNQHFIEYFRLFFVENVSIGTFETKLKNRLEVETYCG